MNIKTFNEKYIGKYYIVKVSSVDYHIVDTNSNISIGFIDLEWNTLKTDKSVDFLIWSDIRRVFRKLKSNRRIR